MSRHYPYKSTFCVVAIMVGQAPWAMATDAPSIEDKTAFYTTIDADGKMHSVPKPIAEITKTSEPSIKVTTTPETTSSTSKSNVNTHKSDIKTESFASENFVDSEYLEEHQFNLEKKKRFYSIPDGTGKDVLVERESGVDLKKFEAPTRDLIPLETVSKAYQTLPKTQMTDLLGLSCIEPKRLKNAKVLKQVPLGVWPLKSFKSELNAEFVRLDQDITDIQVLSFASSTQEPSFYWPMVAFLDDQGCLFAGASQFFQSLKPATSLSYAALQGNLLIPEGARYLMFTPLQQSPDLRGVKLVEKGQLQLKVIEPHKSLEQKVVPSGTTLNH